MKGNAHQMHVALFQIMPQIGKSFSSICPFLDHYSTHNVSDEKSATAVIGICYMHRLQVFVAIDNRHRDQFSRWACCGNTITAIAKTKQKGYTFCNAAKFKQGHK